LGGHPPDGRFYFSSPQLFPQHDVLAAYSRKPTLQNAKLRSRAAAPLHFRFFGAAGEVDRRTGRYNG
jgi:hypothetical protein